MFEKIHAEQLKALTEAPPCPTESLYWVYLNELSQGLGVEARAKIQLAEKLTKNLADAYQQEYKDQQILLEEVCR